MSVRSVLIGVAALGVLSGCVASGLEMAGEPVPARQSGARDAQINRYASVVRTYREVDGKPQEVGGLKCTVRGTVSATVTSPQAVRYSGYIQAERFANRGRPGDLMVTCRGQGLSGSAKVGPGLGLARTYHGGGYAPPGQVNVSVTTIPGSVAGAVPWSFPAEIRVMVE